MNGKSLTSERAGLMYLQFEHSVHDCDLILVEDFFTLLDSRLDQVQSSIDTSSDPDQMGHFDEAEYFCGMGFAACQRYLASTYGWLGIKKPVALGIGPRHVGGETIASILNSAANYWKHAEEWDVHSAILRNRQTLKPTQRDTIRIIETVTPWNDYTCANLLACFTSPDKPRLRCLLPLMQDWRNQLDSSVVG